MPPTCRTQASPARRPLHESRRAVTLIELLAVMAVISLLASLSITTLTGVGRGQNIRRAIVDTSSYLDLARAHAAAKNTYVYVGIDTSGQGVRMLMVESRTGLDAMNSKTTATIGTDPDLALARPIARLDGVGFRDAGNTYTPSIPDRPTNSAESISSDKTIRYQQGGETYTFDRLITFLPTGQIRNGGAFASVMEFGFQEQRDDVVLPNPAAFQLSGLTGQVQVFRPQP